MRIRDWSSDVCSSDLRLRESRFHCAYQALPGKGVPAYNSYREVSEKSMNITFRQIRYFIAVAESRSVSAGSTAVGISQSAVTDAIRTLEIETGVKLFYRQIGRAHV